MDSLRQYFEKCPENAFTKGDLEYLLIEKHQEWTLPPSMTLHTFQEMLLSRTSLEKLSIRSDNYACPVLYSWKGLATPFSVALRLRKEQSFFSHASAMWIHGLSEVEKHIFMNREQSAKPTTSSSLMQESIDRAFQNQQRRSRMMYRYKGSTITLLNGKHTGRMGVETMSAPSGQKIEVSSLERTLIDITVRPAYAGGVSSVLEAYKQAKGRVTIPQLMSLLEQFDYKYPYHQSIGFYLKQATYSEEDQSFAKMKGSAFNFYLTHAMKNPSFDPEWRIFFPQSIR
jgi:hypothetical protein